MQGHSQDLSQHQGQRDKTFEIPVLGSCPVCRETVEQEKEWSSWRSWPRVLFKKIFYFILLYNTALVLPYIDMNPPRVYMSSQSWTPLPPHIISLDHLRAPTPSILYPVLNIDWWFVSYLIVYMFQCHSPKSSYPLPLPQSPKVLSTQVSLLLSCIQGHHYHLSKFHIYVLVYCIGVFLSGLLHSV